MNDKQQEAQRIKRDHDRFAPVIAKLDALEPIAREPGAVDPAAVALSTAVSLKRIADAMQVSHDPAILKSISVDTIERINGDLTDRAEVESIAGDMLNLAPGELENLGPGSAHLMAEKVRRLASAVLRK